MKKNLHEAEFRKKAENVSSWIIQSKQHKFTAEFCIKHFYELKKQKPVDHADELLKETAMYCATMMHRGFAIENVAKAVIVSKNKQIVTEKGRIKSWGCDGHDLVSLVGKSSEKLALEFKDLLQRLMEFSIWAGRYSTSMDVERYTKAKENKHLQLLPSDTDYFNDLYKRLEDLVC